MRNRSQEAFGIFLAVLGFLFLLVSNSLLWFGWDVLWPTLPFLVGLFLLRVYFSRRKPRQLFLGSLLAQFGAFFFLFTSGIVSWEGMNTLWPSVPLMVGVSLLLLSAVVESASSALIVGLFFVLFAVFGYLTATGAIASRISGPLIRLWPLVLIGAGVLVFLRARHDAREADAASPADILDS